MNRFSILDLVILTTAIAGIASSFRVDVWLGIELASVLGTLVLGGLAAMVWSTAPRWAGAAAGLVVAVLAGCFIFRERFDIFEPTGGLLSNGNWGDGPELSAAGYALLWGMFTVALGWLLSPLAAVQWLRSHAADQFVDGKFQQQRLKVVWLFLAGFLLLGILAGIDHSTMQSQRDWIPLQFILGIALIWNGARTSGTAAQWLKRQRSSAQQAEVT